VSLKATRKFFQKGILHMNLAIKSAVAAALLGAVSMSAFATTVNVTPPPSGPAPAPGLGDGGLMAEVFDSLTNHYLTVWLGGDIGTFKASATPAGGITIDFGTLSGFSGLFSSSDVSGGNVQFLVAAANGATAGHNEVITTLAAPQGTVANGAVQNVATALGTAIGGFNAASGCNSVNPCSATSTVSPGFLASISPISVVGVGSAAGTAGGAAVTMYDLVQVKAGLGNGTIAALSNGTGNGAWSLSPTGDLTYTIAGVSAVPLPAAVWLLGSGLLGLAGIGRRKKAAAAVAA
jgi:hypothetical protein